MKPSQLDKLAALESELTDVFLEECKPAEWPALDTQQGRGDRYWIKKNARATLVLIGQIDRLIADNRARGESDPRQPDGEDEIEREARELEKRGRAVLKKHGKALN